MTLEAAIAELEREIEPGLKAVGDRPQFGTTAWFRLRALAIGLSALRQMRAAGKCNNAAEAEAFYRQRVKEVKLPD